MSMPAPAMRYHGGKFLLAPWLISLLPPHRVYVEPYGGAASVLLNKPRASVEVYNDLDGTVVNVFRVLQDPGTSARLTALCRLTPYARAEFDLAKEPSDDPIESARRTLFRSWAGFGSAGATKGHTGFRSYSGSGRSDNVAERWTRVPDQLAAFTDRLRGVIIEQRPALELMRQHDGPDVLFFVDPPYLHETRHRGAQHGRYYRHEMTTADHVELLETIQQLQGMVVLCGYPSDLYGAALPGWTTAQRHAMAAGNKGGVARLEQVWMNPAAAAVQPQTKLVL